LLKYPEAAGSSLLFLISNPLYTEKFLFNPFYTKNPL